MSDQPPVWHRTLPATIIGVVGTAVILYVAKPVVMPLALSVLIAFVLAPVVAFVQRSGLPRVYAVILTAATAALLAGGLGWVVAAQVQGLAVELPKHKGEIQKKIAGLKGNGDGPFGELMKMVQDLTEGPPAGNPPPATPPLTDAPPPDATKTVVVAQPKESGVARLGESVLPVVEPLATAGLVAVLVVFMLANKEDLRDRLLGLAGSGRVSHTSRALGDAGERVGKYLLQLSLVNVGFGVLFALGLWLLGVPFAVLWGFLAAVLRFIPYLGTWAAAGFPVLLSVALSPDWTQPVSVVVFFAVIDVIAANVVEPLLFGHGTGVAPIALLIAAAFWAWIWGPIGLLLATPLTVCLVVLGQHVPRLGFLNLLLGSAPALPPPARLYQRLFARDEEDAKLRVTEMIAERGEAETFDEMVIPALVMARRDRAAGGLDPDGEQFALDAVRRIVAVEDGGPEGRPVVVGVPAHHPAEEATLDMLARVLIPDGVRVDALSSKELPADVAERVAALKPAAVFISVLPPGGLPQAAYLCRMLRKRFPTLRIVVGWWGSERQFDKLLVKLRRAGASYVTTTLKQSHTQMRFVAEGRPPAAARPAEPVGAAS